MNVAVLKMKHCRSFQLRLRSLVRVIGYNLEVDRKHDTCWFYYTLHRSSMSSPLYTSNTVDNASARWASLEVPTIHATGLSAASGEIKYLIAIIK